jgi:hypothetical protein
MYILRCRIPDCDGKETTFLPDWLHHAVPFHQHDARSVPQRCLRFAPHNSSFFSENTGRNDSSCSPEDFDNRSVIRCNEWVYDGEEATILREVGNTVIHLYIRGPFEKFVDSPYYSESELCGGAVTVSFSKYLPLASNALLTTLHPLLENVLQTVDHVEISYLGAPFSPGIAWGEIWTVWRMF